MCEEGGAMGVARRDGLGKSGLMSHGVGHARIWSLF